MIEFLYFPNIDFIIILPIFLSKPALVVGIVSPKAANYAICIYVCPTSAHWSFQHGFRRCKCNIFYLMFFIV